MLSSIQYILEPAAMPYQVVWHLIRQEDIDHLIRCMPGGDEECTNSPTQTFQMFD